MMVRSASIFFLLIAGFCSSLQAQTIIPKPSHINYSGGVYNFSNVKKINISDSSLLYLAEYFNTFIAKKILPVEISKNILEANALNLTGKGFDVANEEAYKLEVTPINIVIQAKPKGVFYGLMTLQQLLFHAGYQKVQVQTIVDSPRFAWRGMHLDVSRHFFDVDFVKKYIDIMALHKMNVFHWHLCDDQGWRIEIKKYPKLCEVGSKRHETMVDKHFQPYVGDGKPVEGFYTQAEVKEIIRYAAQRNITVVPEIEMPGHCQAALAAYPEYSCLQAPMEVLTRWGGSSDVFCVKDSTFQFLFDILDEVMLLFPSTYIHIGGDEVPKARWKACSKCQKAMQVNRLKNTDELQSFFITKVDSFITARGRNTIGWDEILEGGLAPNAAVMSWRGEEGGIAAANLKHKVVMTPGSHCYFDHYQGNKKTEPLAIGGYTTTQKVYSYEPIPTEIKAENRAYILGAQANLWTEYIATEDHVMYMMLPRMCALSEVLWTAKTARDYSDFSSRLLNHFNLLDERKYNYAKAIFDVQAQAIQRNGTLYVKLSSDVSSKTIRYTLDGSEPNEQSAVYFLGDLGLALKKTATLKAALFDNDVKVGKTFSQLYAIHKAAGKKITLLTPPGKSYSSGGSTTLIDGVVGELPWTGKEWLGWNGKDMEATIDLGNVQVVKSIEPKFLRAEESWIHLPKQVDVLYSIDGKNYKLAKRFEAEEIRKLYDTKQIKLQQTFPQLRFVRVIARCSGPIEKGKAGEGEMPWLFCTEIIVD